MDHEGSLIELEDKIKNIELYLTFFEDYPEQSKQIIKRILEIK